MPSPLLLRAITPRMREPAAVLQEDAAGVVAVEVVVVRPVAVEGEVLDRDVRDVLAAREREEGRGGGLALSSQRFSRRALSSLKRLPERATSVRLMTTGPPLSGFLRPQADAVADLEPAGVGQGDLLVVPVGAGRQLGRRPRAP